MHPLVEIITCRCWLFAVNRYQTGEQSEPVTQILKTCKISFFSFPRVHFWWATVAEFFTPFLPRDACISAVFAVARCPSVRLSVRHVGALYPYRWSYRKLLSRPDIPITLVFWPHVRIPNSKGNPSAGAQKHKGVGKFCDFDGNRRLSPKRYEIDPWLLWDVYRKSYALYRMVTFSMTRLNRFSMSRHFWSRISQKRCVLGTKLL